MTPDPGGLPVADEAPGAGEVPEGSAVAGRFPRPRRGALPVTLSVVALGVWEVVAHDSGVGWVQTLGALVAGFLVVGLVAPAVVAAMARCRVVTSPSDTTAGRPTVVEVSVSTPVELRPIDPPGPPVPPGRARTVRLEVVPERRGVVERCRVVIATGAPFGLLWWTRQLTLELPRPLLVAPRTGAPDHRVRVTAALPGAGGRPTSGPGADPDRLRGVREHQASDPWRLVHWRATAHTGALMTRVLDPPRRTAATVRAELPTDPVAADEQAATVLGTVSELLAVGAPVELVTVEPGGEVARPVTSVAEAGRRLALALPR